MGAFLKVFLHGFLKKVRLLESLFPWLSQEGSPFLIPLIADPAKQGFNWVKGWSSTLAGVAPQWDVVPETGDVVPETGDVVPQGRTN